MQVLDSQSNREHIQGMFNKMKMLRMSKKDATGNSTSSNTPEPKTFYTNYNPNSFHFDFEKGHAYDNTYASVKAIANAFLAIRPYAIDSNGKPLNQCRLVDVLSRPNNRMSGSAFREALATMLLTHRSVALLAYHQDGKEAIAGGEITKDNIAGFTFLENYHIQVIDGRKFYKNYDTKQVWSEDEVVEISAGFNPYDLDEGYSPTQAVKKWANVDDYLACYEAGLIENDGMPAGQFVITAPTVEAFNDIVDAMERKHHGAGRNNAPMYVHRPMDTHGEAQAQQVEWIPFSQSNRDLALEPLFNQANDKIDSAFGVPSSIRGVSKENSWASVRTDERIFVTYTVIPFTTKVWNSFTTEMNRITGGLGYALTFDVKTPGIAEEDKVDAERKRAELDLIIQARNAGYTLDSIIDAFDLSNAYKMLESGNTDETEILNDKPEVDEGGEVENAPEETAGEDIERPKASSHACTCGIVAKDNANTDKKRRAELDSVVRDAMIRQIENIIEANGSEPVAEDTEHLDVNGDGIIDGADIQELYQIPDPTEEEDKKLSKQMLAVILAIMVARGIKSQKEVEELMHDEGIDTTDISPYKPDNVTETQYANHLVQVVRSFFKTNSQRAIEIATKTIADASAEGRLATKQEIADNIRKMVKLDTWRVERIARTEEHRANQLAQIDSVIKLQAQTNATIYKVWHRNPASNSCEFCIHMNGQRERVDTAFVKQGEALIGEDGGILANTFQDIEGAYAHPNCACYLTFEVKK